MLAKEGSPAVAVQGVAYVVEVGANLVHAASDGRDEKKGVRDVETAAAISNVMFHACMLYHWLLLHNSQPFELGNRLLPPWMRDSEMPRD